MFSRLLASLLALVIGYVLLKYRRTVLDWTGQWVWAERYLGRGGTSAVIALAGCASLFFGFGHPFGFYDSWLQPAPIQAPISSPRN